MKAPLPNPVHPSTEAVARVERSSRSADRAYQTLTIAAILIVLGSLWVF
jgi:hypothetical protein